MSHKDYYCCGDCGFTGEEDEFLTNSGSLYEPPFLYCPACKSDWIIPAKDCVICGDITSIDELKFDMCEKCREKIEADVESVIDLFVKKACGSKIDDAETDIREFIGEIL